MKGKNFNILGRRPRVLLAPLDWGLGHATRSIPVINGLLNQGCEVIIAADGATRILLENEFPTIRFVELKGYRVRYSHNRSWMSLVLFLQLPKLAWCIYREHRWLHRSVKELSVDAVISDNRMGMYHFSVPCIYITHQLKIRTGSWFTEWLAQKIHYWFINKYHECWVPDAGDENNLAGELSHPDHMPNVPVRYTGPLSRFEKKDAVTKYDLLIILSGPEPQRTVFEKILLRDLESYSGRTLVVRGLPESRDTLKNPSSLVEIQNHLTAAGLNQAILESAVVVGRCGYSSVMDLVKLHKNSILIPTPGQPEQEYLADHLMKHGFFLCVPQDHFSLAGSLNRAKEFSFANRNITWAGHEKIIADFVQGIT